MKLSHLFLPHPQTHKKAHLISIPALAVYIAFFIVLQMGFHLFSTAKPGILGLAANVSQKDLINLTNAKRADLGLPALTEDSRLDAAALAKGQNMFAENYWAHYSPSGKDPWGFILNAGYKFTNAGENLARNFYNSNEVVDAWMASPTHKENIINSKYKNIGMAVLEGTLNGQPTVLVVQEFGTPVESIARLPEVSNNTVNVSGIQSSSPVPTPATTLSPEPPIVTNQTFSQKESTSESVLLAQKPPIQADKNQKISNNVLLDPYLVTKNFGLGLIILIAILTVVDLYVLRRRAVIMLSARHLPHLALLTVATGILVNSNIGSIL